jgi:hypothetical protein
MTSPRREPRRRRGLSAGPTRGRLPQSAQPPPGRIPGRGPVASWSKSLLSARPRIGHGLIWLHPKQAWLPRAFLADGLLSGKMVYMMSRKLKWWSRLLPVAMGGVIPVSVTACSVGPTNPGTVDCAAEIEFHGHTYFGSGNPPGKSDETYQVPRSHRHTLGVAERPACGAVKKQVVTVQAIDDAPVSEVFALTDGSVWVVKGHGIPVSLLNQPWLRKM